MFLNVLDYIVSILTMNSRQFFLWSRRGRDRMVLGFTITYVISAYHHWSCEFESRSGWGVQHYVIKFDSDLRQVDGFSPGTPVSYTNKTDRHDITEILLKVALNTIKQTYKQTISFLKIFLILKYW